MEAEFFAVKNTEDLFMIIYDSAPPADAMAHLSIISEVVLVQQGINKIFLMGVFSLGPLMDTEFIQYLRFSAERNKEISQEAKDWFRNCVVSVEATLLTPDVQETFIKEVERYQKMESELDMSSLSLLETAKVKVRKTLCPTTVTAIREAKDSAKVSAETDDFCRTDLASDSDNLKRCSVTVQDPVETCQVYILPSVYIDELTKSL